MHVATLSAALLIMIPDDTLINPESPLALLIGLLVRPCREGWLQDYITVHIWYNETLSGMVGAP